MKRPVQAPQLEPKLLAGWLYLTSLFFAPALPFFPSADKVLLGLPTSVAWLIAVSCLFSILPVIAYIFAFHMRMRESSNLRTQEEVLWLQ